MMATMNDDGQNMRSLPDGWEWLTIGDVTSPIEKVDPTQKPDKEFTYLDIASIDNSVHKITEPKSYYGADAPSRARQLVQADDVIFSTVRTYLEKIAQVPEIYDGQIASTGFSVLRANEIILPKYLFHYSLSKEFLEPLNELQRGTSYPAVRDGDVRAQLIPVAPLSEQERIVNRIEELFSDLEAGVAALERVRAGLKRYKASVLKAAVEGKLLEKSSEFSEEWRFVKLGSVFQVKIGKTPSRSKPEFWNGDIHWVSSGEVINSRVKETREKITEQGLGNTKLYPIGTVLLAMIGEGKTRGQAAILDIEATTNQNIGAILSNPAEAIPEWVFYWLLSRYEETRKSGVGGMQYALNSERIRNFDIPLPPLDEQRRIVAEVERRLSVVREVESAVEVGLVRAGRLRQAVLRSAFEGRL
jgi:type I restriction enzyme S subunit